MTDAGITYTHTYKTYICKHLYMFDVYVPILKNIYMLSIMDPLQNFFMFKLVLSMNGAGLYGYIAWLHK